MAKRQKYSLVFLISLMALFSMQTSSSAHVRVVSTTPESNSTVEHLPARVVIQFNEPLIVLGEQNPNSITVTSDTGASAARGQAQVNGSRISIGLNHAVTDIGNFTVNYRVVSNDGHAVSGSFSFRLARQGLEKTGPTRTETPAEAVNTKNPAPILGILGVLTLLAIGFWALYRTRFARRK